MPKSVDIIFNCPTLVTVVSPYQPLLCLTREMGNVDSCCIRESSTKPGKVVTKLRQISLQIVCKLLKISNNQCHGRLFVFQLQMHATLLPTYPMICWYLTSLSKVMVTPTVLEESSQASVLLSRRRPSD